MKITNNFDFEDSFIKYKFNDALKVGIKSEAQGAYFIYMRWSFPIDKSLKVLADAEKKGCGDLECKPIDYDFKETRFRSLQGISVSYCLHEV